jgi:hypothetical protein
MRIEGIEGRAAAVVTWRRLSWARGVTLAAIASLAIGIGFNTALFAIVDAVLFKPLPVSAPARLVDVFTSDSTGTVEFSTSSYPDYLDLTAQNDVFDGVVGYSPMFAALNLDGRSRLAMGEIVTGNYFQVFGVGAALGRTILPSDDVPGAPKVVFISRRYWTRELGSAPDVVGRTLRIRGTPYTIVGVSTAAFNGMVPILAPEMWITVAASLDVEPVGMHDALPSPTGTIDAPWPGRSRATVRAVSASASWLSRHDVRSEPKPWRSTTGGPWLPACNAGTSAIVSSATRACATPTLRAMPPSFTQNRCSPTITGEVT